MFPTSTNISTEEIRTRERPELQNLDLNFTKDRGIENHGFGLCSCLSEAFFSDSIYKFLPLTDQEIELVLIVSAS